MITDGVSVGSALAEGEEGVAIFGLRSIDWICVGRASTVPEDEEVKVALTVYKPGAASVT